MKCEASVVLLLRTPDRLGENWRLPIWESEIQPHGAHDQSRDLSQPVEAEKTEPPNPVPCPLPGSPSS